MTAREQRIHVESEGAWRRFIGAAVPQEDIHVSRSGCDDECCKVTFDEREGLLVSIPVCPRDGQIGVLALGLCLLAGPFVTIFVVLLVAHVLSFLGMTIAEPYTRLSSLVSLGVVSLFMLALLALGVHELAAQEIIQIDGKRLTHWMSGSFFGRKRSFDLANLRNLRFYPYPNDRIPRTSLAFDHFGRTYHFGRLVFEWNVLRLITTIQERYPIPDEVIHAPAFPVHAL